MLSWKSGTTPVFHFAINFKGSIQSNSFHQDIHIRMSAHSVLTSLSPTAFPCPSPSTVLSSPQSFCFPITCTLLLYSLTPVRALYYPRYMAYKYTCTYINIYMYIQFYIQVLHMRVNIFFFKSVLFCLTIVLITPISPQMSFFFFLQLYKIPLCLCTTLSSSFTC